MRKVYFFERSRLEDASKKKDETKKGEEKLKVFHREK